VRGGELGELWAKGVENLTGGQGEGSDEGEAIGEAIG
jgi:hypothetical protein